MSGGPPLVFLVAGEPSGDLLGAGLMTALRELTGGKIAFAGVGGERMTDSGLDSLFPMSELSTMGLVEVLPRVPRLYRRLRRTAAAVRDLRPAVVVTIDSPGFNTPLARRLQGIDAPLIHYVAPTVWAWRAARAKTLARLYDRLLALLPFEPPLFEREGLPCVWVGHPAAAAAAPDGAGFRARRGVAPDAPLLAVLPGSRAGEVRRLLPVYLAAVGRIASRLPRLRVVTATVPAVAEAVTGAPWPVPPVVVREPDERGAALAAADAAIATSGTVTLELAAARTPMVVCYRVAPLTYAIARRLVRAPFFALVNVALGRRAVPELLQSACTADGIARRVEPLLIDSRARGDQITALEHAVAALRGPDGNATPSARAARVVFDTMTEKGKAADVRHR